MAQNEKGGADLDIFEDLGKKAAPARPSGRSVPPPPPSLRTADGAKRTLLGVTAPVIPAAVPSAPEPAAFPAAPPSPARLPPPPPGRASLPPVVAPPPSRVAPVPAPPPAKAANSVDVDWDDEDEATQVFAEEATHIFAEEQTHVFMEDAPKNDKPKASLSAPMPAAGIPAAVSSRPKATLLGLTAPQGLPPPSRPRTTPPPPPSRNSWGAPGSSGLPFPPPPMGPGGFGSGGPAPSSTQKGLGGAGAPWSSMPAPPPMPAMPALPRPASAPDYGSRNMEATTMLAPKGPAAMRVVIIGAAVGLAILAVALFAMPQKGRIAVNVTDQRGAGVNRVDIFVDGKKMSQCDTAPCVLEGQTTGSHEVKVLAEGYDAPAVKAIVVDAHHDTPADFVVGSSRGTGIKVSGVQAGVKLYIDDKEVGPLPQDVHDLAPGDHAIHIAGSERYQPFDRHVIVERDRVEDLGTVTLKVLKGKVTVAPGTVGARVYIVSGSDRRELPMLPISVDIDTTKSWSLEASKPGYDDYRQLISFDDGQAEKAYTVNLEQKGPGAQPPAAAPYYPPAPSPGPAPRPAPAPVAQAPAPSGEGGEGFLNINSIPPSTCYLDGRSLGSTPKVHISVKPGSHTVKFVDSDDGLTKSIFVSVGAGETKTAATKL